MEEAQQIGDLLENLTGRAAETSYTDLTNIPNKLKKHEVLVLLVFGLSVVKKMETALC